MANISQTSFIHTNPGAADDQKIAVGPGIFTSNPSFGHLSATPAGLTTVTANTDLNSTLHALAFTPAQVTLTGNQTLETDFTIYVGDGYGDFDTFNRALIEMAPAAPASTTPSTPVTTAPRGASR